MEYYSESKTWTEQFPSLLPPENRLHESQVEEYYWNWNNNKVHVDHYKCEASPVRIVMLHGVGGNGRLLSFIAAPLHRSNLELIALDLPGYGLTKMNDKIITYKHWIEMGRDFLDKEQQNDPRPIILFGLSAGGMLTYQVACLNKKIKGIIVTTLLDQRLMEVRRYSAIYPWMARLMGPFLKTASAIMPGVLIPMKKVANMKAIVNNKELLSLLINDPTSSGTKVSIAFINTLLEAYPEIEPEEFDLCPMLLAHPEKDLWTPVEISELFFNRLHKINKQLVILENAGHFPIESPGLQQLEENILRFIGELK
jgi:alpha-beta hydrolase superfamily lysophospholipase